MSETSPKAETARCLHCHTDVETTQLVLDKVCIDCCADSTLGRIDFSKERFAPLEGDLDGEPIRVFYRRFQGDFEPLLMRVIPLEEDTEPELVDFDAAAETCQCQISGTHPMPQLDATLYRPSICLNCGRIWSFPPPTKDEPWMDPDFREKIQKSLGSGGVFQTGTAEEWKAYREAVAAGELAEKPGKEGRYSPSGVYKVLKQRILRDIELLIKRFERENPNEEAIAALHELMQEVESLETLQDQYHLLCQIRMAFRTRFAERDREAMVAAEVEEMKRHAFDTVVEKTVENTLTKQDISNLTGEPVKQIERREADAERIAGATIPEFGIAEKELNALRERMIRERHGGKPLFAAMRQVVADESFDSFGAYISGKEGKDPTISIVMTAHFGAGWKTWNEQMRKPELDDARDPEGGCLSAHIKFTPRCDCAPSEVAGSLTPDCVELKVAGLGAMAIVKCRVCGKKNDARVEASGMGNYTRGIAPTHEELKQRIEQNRLIAKARKHGLTLLEPGDEIVKGDLWFDRESEVFRESAPSVNGVVPNSTEVFYFRPQFPIGGHDAAKEHRLTLEARGVE